MIISLDRQQRRRLLMWSSTLCIGSTMLAPLAARSSRPLYEVMPVRGHAGAVMAFIDDGTASVPKVARDPFVGEDGERTGSAPLIGVQASSGVVGNMVQAGMPIVPLPANSGAAIVADARPLNNTERVTGVILGEHPQALLRSGELTRIVTVGDRINGRIVRKIDDTGVRLEDGSLLVLQDEVQQ